MDGTDQVFGYDVSDLQTDVAVADGAITGTLSYIDSGSLPAVWGNGNFIALDFTDIDSDATSVKVGLEPSVSSGLVELDEDHAAVMKITDKATQKLVVVQSNANFFLKQRFDLSGLTLLSE